jgi:tetratricopeptide (TPR) repeat protein
LRVRLKPGENLVNNRAIDPDSYGQFLRAKALLRRAGAGAADALAILEPLVAHSPNYAPAWEELGLSYFYMTLADPGQRATYIAKLEAAADHAVALDPKSGLGRAEQVYFKDIPRKWAIMEDAYASVLSLDPYRPDMLLFYSDVLRAVGRVKDNLAKKRQLIEIEPLVPNYIAQYAQALWLDGQTDAAIKILEGSSPQGFVRIVRDVAQYYASLGRFQEAADAIARVPQTPANAELLRSAAALLRSAPAKVPAPEKLPALGRAWGFIYLYVGAPERVLDSYGQETPLPSDIAYLWHSSYADVRKTERFKAVVRQLKIVDYWRERGWPSFCHPTTGDEFVCN